MLDSLVKASEKVVQLLEYRDKRQRLRYEVAVAPLYKALGEVHVDYLRMLREVLEGLEKDEDLKVLARNVYWSGYMYDPVRKDTLAKLRAFSASVDERPFKQFYRAGVQYLTPPERLIEEGARRNGMQISSVRAMVHEAVRAAGASSMRGLVLSQGHVSHPERRLLTVFVTATLDQLRTDWELLAVAHAEAQAAVLP